MFTQASNLTVKKATLSRKLPLAAKAAPAKAAPQCSHCDCRWPLVLFVYLIAFAIKCVWLCMYTAVHVHSCLRQHLKVHIAIVGSRLHR